jgi:hypothetical protein
MIYGSFSSEISFLKLKYNLAAMARKGLYFFDFENNEIHIDAFS